MTGTLRVAGLIERTRGRRLGREGTRLVAGLVLIVLVLFGQTAYGAATAAWRLDPALRDAAETSSVIVVLDFIPERFHTERLSNYGVFSGRAGAVNRIRLRNVTAANLKRLSRLVWVARVVPASVAPSSSDPGANLPKMAH